MATNAGNPGLPTGGPTASRRRAVVCGTLRKIGYIDLMAIADPQKLACKPLDNGVLTFPFFTIENVGVVDATTGLIIERDNGEGTAANACPAGEKRTDCFHDTAKFKRVYKIEMTDANVGNPVRKIGYIDLMNIADPQKLARKPLDNGVLTFPFFTIENVGVVDATHIVVGNDNNLPFSSSRKPNQADDNELILLAVGDFLKAR